MDVLRVAVTVFLLAQTASTSDAAEISFFCTDARAPSMGELIPKFEKASGHHVENTVANPGTVAALLQNGERADLGAVLPPAWDRLRQGGRIDPSARCDLVIPLIEPRLTATVEGLRARCINIQRGQLRRPLSFHFARFRRGSVGVPAFPPLIALTMAMRANIA